MKRFLTGFLIAVFMLAPAMAEQVPFARPPSDRNPSESAVGALANIMATIQLRHLKLWFIGKAKNWDLLNYEAKKLEVSSLPQLYFIGIFQLIMCCL